MSLPPKTTATAPSLFGLLRHYWVETSWLILFTAGASGLGLFIPKLIAQGIDTYTQVGQVPLSLMVLFALVVIGILGFNFAKSLMGTFASEKIARDLRRDLAAKISRQRNITIEALSEG